MNDHYEDLGKENKTLSFCEFRGVLVLRGESSANFVVVLVLTACNVERDTKGGVRDSCDDFGGRL